MCAPSYTLTLQDMVLFNDSIYYNIAYGDLGASREKVSSLHIIIMLLNTVVVDSRHAHVAQEHEHVRFMSMHLAHQMFFVTPMICMFVNQSCVVCFSPHCSHRFADTEV